MPIRKPMTTTTTMSPIVVKIHRNRAKEVVAGRGTVPDDAETR
jgi:hypothetical protein